LLLLHVPPVEGFVNAVVAPVHTLLLPLITPGAAFTVTTVVAEHDPTAYVIVVVPADTAETTPVLLTVATAVLPLLHEPPDVELVRFAVAPTHNVVDPLIADGAAFTVIAFVAAQPVPVEYVIVATPALTPPTIPVAPTDATAVLLLLHVPPAEGFVNAVVAPVHTLLLPLITPGAAFTVTTVVALHDPTA
jgi:hypothetical protein